MPHFLIHVGPHKTGTTYLQLRFAAARERLHANGVSYPHVWNSAEGEPSHRKLFVSLRESRIAELRSQFATIRLDGPQYVLISAEGLNHLDQTALGLLSDLIAGDRVTIIFYVRRWSELLPSLWQETVKHGDSETFPDFLALHLANPTDSPVLNLTQALNRYATVFGRSNVAIVSYSNLGDQGIDLADHFLQTFLPSHRHILTNLPQIPEARPNRSLPVRDIEIIRALNSLAMRDGGERSSRLRDWFFTQRGRFDLNVLHSAIDANLTTLSFSDASFAMSALHNAIYQAYADRLLPPTHPGSVFKPRAADICFVCPRYLTDVSAHRCLAHIYTAYREDEESSLRDADETADPTAVR